MARNLAFLIV